MKLQNLEVCIHHPLPLKMCADSLQAYRESYPKPAEYKYRDPVMKLLRGNEDLLASIREFKPDYDAHYKLHRYGGGKRAEPMLESAPEDGNDSSSQQGGALQGDSDRLEEQRHQATAPTRKRFRPPEPPSVASSPVSEENPVQRKSLRTRKAKGVHS